VVEDCEHEVSQQTRDATKESLRWAAPQPSIRDTRQSVRRMLELQ